MITYANTPVVATNYKSYSSGRYSTPPGFYAYPLKELGDHTASFAKDYKYMLLTRLTTDKILNFGNYSKRHFEVDIERLKELVPPEIVEASITDNIQHIIFNIANKTGSVYEQSKLYMKLGYTVLMDPGLGLIHKNEPRQTVVLSPKTDLELIGTFISVYDVKELAAANSASRDVETLQKQLILSKQHGLEDLLDHGIKISEEMQIAAVSRYNVINKLIEAGIVPSGTNSSCNT